ncbi:LysR family transcriptional regulator [Shewanella sp. VB17]|uniref:LysR family transcriptional regulator n=1 Tax=Shewanella sp. VB17 TaxID=2739432 RepID=UPI0015656BF7|nr:LysR family transcriptional regulator [Shewanella sp. VB17]NRD75234.1 LysR family transcriptional regulator [Shewanella sp. VB17]
MNINNISNLPSYTLDQLLAFAAVAESGSYTLGAKNLRKDRTTVREHIDNLQISLDLTLFEKDGNKLILTPIGQKILRGASSVLFYTSSLEIFAQNLAINSSNKLEYTIAFSKLLPTTMSIEINQAVHKEFPSVVINWLTKNKKESLQAIKNESCDLAIIPHNNEIFRLIPPAGLDICYLGKINGAFYANHDSPLAKLNQVSFHDLMNETRYVLSSIVEEGLGERASYSLKQVQLSSLEHILAFLETDGWSYLPQHYINSKKSPHIVKLNLSFLNQPWCIDHSLFFKKSISEPILELIKKTIKESYNIID